jgi:hypothetical protein
MWGIPNRPNRAFETNAPPGWPACLNKLIAESSQMDADGKGNYLAAKGRIEHKEAAVEELFLK